MTSLWLLPAAWLALGLLAIAVVADRRYGQRVVGPFTAPTGRTFKVTAPDHFADWFGTGTHATTVGRVIGLANAEAAQGISGPLLAHECVHVAQGCWLWPISVPIFLPAYLLLAWLGKNSPWEKPGWAEQARIAALPPTDPTWIAWDQLASRVNAALKEGT